LSDRQHERSAEQQCAGKDQGVEQQHEISAERTRR
jgi:hypothetical protein